jgi:hypothetical protein
MNMTNEQIRQQQFSPATNRNQRHYGTLAQPNREDPLSNDPSADAPIQIEPPRDPAKRQEFWLDTCCGVAHLQIACAQIQELYRKHGCRFAAPTPQQVRGILDALDGAMPQWEKEHPELFYQTLELSFPELVIRR